MQFQVPQFIDTEDKVVGPLSLRQFAFVAAGGILSAILYFAFQIWLWALGSIVIFGIAFALAFIKIEGRPFMSVILSAFNFYWKPQTYVWQPEHPTVRPSEKSLEAEAGSSGLADILSKSAEKIRSAMPHTVPQVIGARPGRAAAAPEPQAVGQQSRLQPQPPQPAARPISRESVKAGSALHKSWEDLQTGAPLTKKNSDKEFLEKKMAERYQIFQRLSGERSGARRVDYR